MPEPLAEQIINKMKQAPELYHRLLLVVGPFGSGKTAALQKTSEHIDIPLVNLNLELSRLMLELTEKQRALQLPFLVQDIIEEGDSDIILVDNTEILFDVRLKQDPLRLLQGQSRNKTLIATWNGDIDGNYLTYATPGHPEYRRYETQDLLVASPAAINQ